MERKKPRKRKKPVRRSFRIARKQKAMQSARVPGSFQLLRQVLKQIISYKKQFLGVVLIYLLLNLVFVRGFSSSIDLSGIRDAINESGQLSASTTNFTLLGVVLGSGSGTRSDIGNLYQSIFIVVSALALIWLFRQTQEKPESEITVKQPFYEGMGQIIPFVLVLLIVGLQFLPMLAGLGLLNVILANGLAATFVEQLIWSLLAFLLSLLSFYMISSSIFALIIVTLPETTPVIALKAAKKLVDQQRFLVLRRIFWVSIVLFISFAAVLFASVVAIPAAAEWVFFVLGGILLPLIVGYIYKLYRALL